MPEKSVYIASLPFRSYLFLLPYHLADYIHIYILEMSNTDKR